MSRHELDGLDRSHKVIVGWDHPLQTFFIQVIDRAREDAGRDDKFVLWAGTEFREIYEIDELVARGRRFVHLNSELRSTLYGDRDEGR